MSGFSVSYKTGMAIGGAVMGYIIPSSYVPQAAEQTSEVLNFFFNCSTLIPLCCSILCLIASIAVIVIGTKAKIGEMEGEK